MRELCDPKSEMKLKTSLQMFFSSDWVATFKRQFHLLSLDVDSLQQVHLQFFFIFALGDELDIGAIFLRRFRLYMLSFMFRFMFANICFEKNQNSKIHVMFIINIT